MSQFIKKYYFVLALIGIEIIIFIANYQSGTFLVGWDNLFPELNFSVNIKRSLFATWEEYRGLGLLDGMSYAANLPHYLFLYLLSFFLPLNILRYIFFFLMHFLGGLGIYFLSGTLLPKSRNKNFYSFVCSLFYLLNLATIQIFFAPYELFAVHFAFLPWLAWSSTNFLRTGERKSFAWFIFFSILAIPQAHVPTIFVVYLLFISTFLFFTVIQKKPWSVKKSVILLSTIFIINSYWLLPYLYGLKQNAPVIVNAKINQMSSQDVFLKNRFRGSLSDIALLKGFMLDMTSFDQSGKTVYIMERWREHLGTVIFIIPSLFIILFTLVGLEEIIKKREAHYYPYIFIFLISFLFLGSAIPGISFVNDALRNTFPIFGEAFRFSFTKFSIVFILSYGLFFARGVEVISEAVIRFSGKISKKNFEFAFKICIFLLFLFYSLPTFRGEFLFKSLENKIPNEYFQTINFFNKQDLNTRIATFPQNTYWSWRFYRWGNQGSGFLWYGIPQPTLDRAFDPWSNYNENYYWEISQALYAKNPSLLEDILEKYQINWLLVDENVINPPSSKALSFDELETMINQSGKIKLAKTFGKIRIYQVDLGTPIKNFVFLAQNLVTVEPAYQWNNFDQAYQDYGNYITSQFPISNFQFPIYYPFRSLFTGRTQTDLEFMVKENNGSFIFQKTIPNDLKKSTLELPEFNKETMVLVDPYNLGNVSYFAPEVSRSNNQIEVKVPKIGGFYSSEIDPTQTVLQAKNCNQFTQGKVKNEIRESFLRQTSQNATNCSLSFSLPSLPHSLSYLITLESKNISGKSLLFWLEDLNLHRPEIETYLPKGSGLSISYLVVPPMAKDDLGYTLHFDNSSIGQEQTINDLGRITVNPIPWNFIAKLKLVKENSQPVSWQTFPLKEVFHPNPGFYKMDLDGLFKDQPLTLVLSQSFDPGWQAYRLKSNLKVPNSILQFLAPILGKKIGNHILVNNWENGWMIDSKTDGLVVLIFWPQYLEFLGLGLLVVLLSVSFVYLIVKPRIRS